MTRKINRIGRLFAVALLAITACGSNHATPEPEPSPERWPALNSELSFVWSAEPGIDLLGGASVVVRAYYESVWIAGEAGDEGLLYPGFEHAVANEADAEPGSLPLWPVIRRPYGKQRVGTMRDHILRMTDKGTTVEAVMCHWTWGIATLLPNATYWGGDDHAGRGAGVTAIRITLVRPADPADSLPSQRGPSKYSFDDVFGGWRIVGRLDQNQLIPGQEADWPEFQQDREACIAKAPESAERRMFLKGGEHPRSDFPTLPPYPGWPLPRT